MRNLKATAFAVGLALAIAGCGGDEDAEDTSGATTGAETTVPERRSGGEDGREPAKPKRDADERPNNDPVVKEDQGTKPVGKLIVNEREFKIALSEQALLTEGVWTVKVINRGKLTHALDIEGPNGETEVGKVAPGETKAAKVYLVSGEYELYCPIADHAERGMRTTLPVGADKNPG